MRKVSKNFDDIPPVLLNETCQRLIAVSLTEKGAHKFKTDMYGHKVVREALDKIYKSKCAFCETDTSAGATLQVEHYRPKAKVTGAQTHPGYYWLGYQWSNLLLACSSCNNRKRNHFPVNSARIDKPPLKASKALNTKKSQSNGAALLSEVPQLVNPEIDPTPMQHFRFQADGTIEHKTSMGETTIKTCNLNRGRLVIWRKKVYDNIFNKFLKNFDRFQQGKLNADQLKTRLLAVIEDDLITHINDEDQQYLEFALTCWKEFENFFIARFQPAHQTYLNTIYRDLLTEINR